MPNNTHGRSVSWPGTAHSTYREIMRTQNVFCMLVKCQPSNISGWGALL